MSKNREDVTQVPDAADKPPEVTAKTDLPSPSSKFRLSHDEEKVNNVKKGAFSQGEGASFFDENFEKTIPKINPDEVIAGMWEDASNSEKDIKNKPDVIDDAETTLKIKLGFVDDRGQLTFIPANAIITDTKVIAGTDVKNEFRDVKKYVDKYGGKESDYRKIAGKIESAKYVFDIHFVKDKFAKEYDFKIKSKTLKREKDDR